MVEQLMEIALHEYQVCVHFDCDPAPISEPKAIIDGRCQSSTFEVSILVILGPVFCLADSD